MIGTHEESGTRKNERAIPHKISVEANMFFLPRKYGDNKDDGVGIKESTLDPAEQARPEMRKLGVEQAAYNATDCDEERKQDSIFTEKCADAFAPASVAKRCREKHEEKNTQDIYKNSKKGENIGDALNKRSHEC